jgi:hypothetical protein
MKALLVTAGMSVSAAIAIAAWIVSAFISGLLCPYDVAA